MATNLGTINLTNGELTKIFEEKHGSTSREVHVYMMCNTDSKENQSTLNWAIRVCNPNSPASTDRTLVSKTNLKINGSVVYSQEKTGPTTQNYLGEFPAEVGYVSSEDQNRNWPNSYSEITKSGKLTNKNEQASRSRYATIDTKPIIITHNNNGTKQISVEFNCSIYEHRDPPEQYTATINLPQIDRRAPSITLASAESSDDGSSLLFSIDTSSQKNIYSIDRWEYSVDGGSKWGLISSNSGTSLISKSISGFTPGTDYTILLRVRDSENWVYSDNYPLSASTNFGIGIQNISDLVVDRGGSSGGTSGTIFTGIAHVPDGPQYTYNISFGTGLGLDFSSLFTINNVQLQNEKRISIDDLSSANMAKLLAQIPNDEKYSIATARLDIYSNSVLIGSSDNQFKITTTSNGSGVAIKSGYWDNIFFTSLNKDDYVGDDLIINNESDSTINTVYFLKGYSNICAKILDFGNTVEFKNRAQFSRIEMTIGKIIRTSSSLPAGTDKIFNFGEVGSYGPYLGNIRIYDSRGYSISKNINVIFRDYFSPSVTTSALSISRNSEGKFQIDISGDKQFRGNISRKTNLSDSSAWNSNTINALYYYIRANNESTSGTWGFVDISNRIVYNTDDSWYVNGNSPIILGNGTWQDSSPYYIDIFVADKCHGNLNVSWPNIPTNAFAYTSFSLPKDPLVAIRKGFVDFNCMLKENGEGVLGVLDWATKYGPDGTTITDHSVDLDTAEETGIYIDHELDKLHTNGVPENCTIGQGITLVLSNRAHKSQPTARWNNILQIFIHYSYRGTTYVSKPDVYFRTMRHGKASGGLAEQWDREQWSQRLAFLDDASHSGGSTWNDISNKPFAGINGAYLDVLENDLTVDPGAIIYWLVHTSTGVFDKSSLTNENEHIPSSSAVLYTLNQKLGDVQTVISQINSLIGG